MILLSDSLRLNDKLVVSTRQLHCMTLTTLCTLMYYKLEDIIITATGQQVERQKIKLTHHVLLTLESPAPGSKITYKDMYSMYNYVVQAWPLMGKAQAGCCARTALSHARKKTEC